LINNFDSGRGGTSELSMEKTGANAYLKIKNLRLDGLWTASRIYGGRISYDVESLSVMGSPLTVGATYVIDTDGINETAMDKGLITRPQQEGYAADIGLPIGGAFCILYTEYAELKNRGNGGAAGIKGNILDFFDYKAEYRLGKKGFVPGYFNSTYMGSSFDFDTQALQTDSQGFVAETNIFFLQNRFKTGISYEAYKDRSLLTGSLGWQGFLKTSGVINYSQPFSGSNNAIVEADLAFVTGGFLDYIVHVKRIYLGPDSFTESYGFSVGMNLDKLVPHSWLSQ